MKSKAWNYIWMMKQNLLWKLKALCDNQYILQNASTQITNENSKNSQCYKPAELLQSQKLCNVGGKWGLKSSVSIGSKFNKAYHKILVFSQWCMKLINYNKAEYVMYNAKSGITTKHSFIYFLLMLVSSKKNACLKVRKFQREIVVPSILPKKQQKSVSNYCPSKWLNKKSNIFVWK